MPRSIRVVFSVLLVTGFFLGTLSSLHAQISGAVTGSANFLIWYRDDWMQSGLTDTITERDNPFFFRTQLEINNIFGLRGIVSIFTDKLLDPLGIFARDLSVKTGVTYGGVELDLYGSPINSHVERWFGWNPPVPLYPEFHYKYRTMRWTVKIDDSDPLINVLEPPEIYYFDEQGDYTILRIGNSITTGARLHDFQLGLVAPLVDNPSRLSGGYFLSLHGMHYVAPCQLYLQDPETYDSLEVLMVLPTTYMGLLFGGVMYAFGAFGDPLQNCFKIALGMGSLFQENQFLTNSAGAFELYGLYQQVFPFDDEMKSGLVLGVEAFSLIIVDVGGGRDRLSDGTPLYITYTTTDSYVIPYVKLVFRF
ncbi:MAG: hypothetical protein WHT84_06920 [Breznakiellaceae bacterium]